MNNEKPLKLTREEAKSLMEPGNLQPGNKLLIRDATMREWEFLSYRFGRVCMVDRRMCTALLTPFEDIQHYDFFLDTTKATPWEPSNLSRLRGSTLIGRGTARAESEWKKEYLGDFREPEDQFFNTKFFSNNKTGPAPERGSDSSVTFRQGLCKLCPADDRLPSLYHPLTLTLDNLTITHSADGKHATITATSMGGSEEATRSLRPDCKVRLYRNYYSPTDRVYVEAYLGTYLIHTIRKGGETKWIGNRVVTGDPAGMNVLTMQAEILSQEPPWGVPGARTYVEKLVADPAAAIAPAKAATELLHVLAGGMKPGSPLVREIEAAMSSEPAKVADAMTSVWNSLSCARAGDSDTADLFARDKVHEITVLLPLAPDRTLPEASAVTILTEDQKAETWFLDAVLRDLTEEQKADNEMIYKKFHGSLQDRRDAIAGLTWFLDAVLKDNPRLMKPASVTRHRETEPLCVIHNVPLYEADFDQGVPVRTVLEGRLAVR